MAGFSTSVSNDKARRLAATLRLVGVGKLVLAALTLVLAFTGYDTDRNVNTSFLIIGVNLILLGLLCLSVGKSFGLASGEQVPPRFAEALQKANKLFGYYLFLLGLAVLGVGVDTVMFLVKIASR